MHVKLLIGANAYACIEDEGVKHDVLLSPGKSAQASLREYAADARRRVATLLEHAERAERAVYWLDAQV